MADAILTLNSGSSSIKFALFEIENGHDLKPLCRGQVESVRTAPHFIVHSATGACLAEQNWPEPPEFDQLLETVIGWAETHLNGDRLVAIGHRIVHGGPDFAEPVIASAQIIRMLETFEPLAPLHQPHNLAPLRPIAVLRPHLPQILCFDTAFHHTMPRLARLFALPRAYEAAGIRRYGFHGLSYDYISRQLTRLAPGLANGRVIVAHLGNGASLCAMRAGRSVDTTMGFSTLDGLMMGTRCGALDPGVILHLQAQSGMTCEAVHRLLYDESGLLGVSGGLSGDMRRLLASTDPQAGEAVDLFVYRIAREIGALTSSLGGLDGLVFTAGIGENAAPVRAMVCARLGWLSLKLDEAANAVHAPRIDATGSAVAVHIISTNEEWMIARHALDLLAAGAEANS